MQLEILCQPDRSLRTTRAALGCRPPPNDQSRSGFSTDCRLPCFLSKSLKASTAKAFSVVSFSTASTFRARQPSAFTDQYRFERARIAGARPGCLWPAAHWLAYVKLMTAALGTSRCIGRGFSSRNMRRSVPVMPRRRLEKVVNKVADDTSNLRLKALPVGLGGFHHSTLGRL